MSRPRIDSADKHAFLAALRDGHTRDEAAAHARHTRDGFYYARKQDPLFAAAWGWADELAAADLRAARAAPDPDAAAAPGTATINAGPHRQLQRRRSRRDYFNDQRKRDFLDHFAGCADAHAAARAAGVGYSTVMHCRRRDSDFAAAWDEALRIAYAQLEAEAVRTCLAAQADLRDGLTPRGELAKEFDRVLALLNRYDRRDGRIGLRERGPGALKRWSFDDAIELLDKKLTAIAAPVTPRPREG